MSEVHGSTSAGSTLPSSSAAPSSPSTTGGDGALGSVVNATLSGTTTGTEARAHAVQTTFLEPALAASTESQPPPLFGDGLLLSFRDHENGFSTASSALPKSEPSPANADSDLESDAIAAFDRLISDESEPDEVWRFFAELGPVERERLTTERADVVGNLDGAPAAMRDRANRQLLQRDLERLEAKAQAGTLARLGRQALENIHTVQSAIAKIEARSDPGTGEPLASQLYSYEPFAFGGDGRVAVSVGDLDAADHVAVMASGLGSSMDRMDARNALSVYTESRERSVDTRESIAILDWVGYDAPSGGLLRGDAAAVVTQRMARAGAEYLTGDVEGLRSMRGDQVPHLTVIGHSYGATTAAIAADEFGVAADDLVLLGSPGTGHATNAEDLTTGWDHTWVGSASRDFVTSFAVTGLVDPMQILAAVHGIPPELLGADPAEDDFDAQRFRAESVDRGNGWNTADHLSDRYYEEGAESLFNVAAIVTGNYDRVLRAEPRRDPWYAPLQDPERHRTPRAMSP